MVSRATLLCVAALALLACSMEVTGRQLQTAEDNSGRIRAKTLQIAANIAKHSSDVNQANANQNAQAAGNWASASNDASVSQSNGRKLQTATDNSGRIRAKTAQVAANIAKGSSYVNQANANQNAQAAGNEAYASNSASVSQSNGW